MDVVTKEIRRVQAVLRRRKLSRRSLATVAGISDTVLIRALDADWNPRSDTLAALSKALDLLDGKPKKAARRRRSQSQIGA